MEGCDRTGKSTLAKALAEDLELPILKFGVPPELGVYDYFMDHLKNFEGSSVIVDRLHLSNYAYNGQLGGDVLLAEEWSLIDNYVARHDGHLFLLVDTPFAVEQRLRAEGPSEASELKREQIGLLCSRFNASFAASSIRVKGSYLLPQLVEPGSEVRRPRLQALIDLLRDRLEPERNK